jgi:hypothetical protein
MSGYLDFNRTGFAPFDAVLSKIEDAGNGFHHTSQWTEEIDGVGKSYNDQINELITTAYVEFQRLSAENAAQALLITSLKEEKQEMWGRLQKESAEFVAFINGPHSAVCTERASVIQQLSNTQRQNAELKEDNEQAYISLAINGVRPNSLLEGIADLEQQAILRDLEIVRLREALLNVRHDVSMVSSCFMDSVVTHGTKGGWLDDEAFKLSGCISEIDAALSTPIDLSALARHDEEIVGPWKRDAERYRWLRTFNVDSYKDLQC